MKRFLIKLLAVALVFFIPAAYFHFVVVPNISGDMGKLAMIPFGKEYGDMNVPGYERPSIENADVLDVYSPDSLAQYPVVSIGDSFSQFGTSGYQWLFSSMTGMSVANFRYDGDLDIMDSYVALLNGGFLHHGQTVILESVERSFAKRFCQIDFDAEFREQPTAIKKTAKVTEPFLNRFFSWIRLSLGIKNPIQSFHLNKPCFTHPSYSEKLYIYNSREIQDGDLLWEAPANEKYSKMNDNLDSLTNLSAQKRINLVILIATDKYDAYSPWIKEDHEDNPTLSLINPSPRIFSPRESLREAIGNDVPDVYKHNDTHWSVIGADITARSLYAWMEEHGVLPQCTSSQE